MSADPRLIERAETTHNGMDPTLLCSNPSHRVPVAPPPLSLPACFFPPPFPSVSHQLQGNDSASARPLNMFYLLMQSTFQTRAWPGPDCDAFHVTWSPRCAAIWLNDARNTPGPSELPGRGGGGDAGGGGLAPPNEVELGVKSGSINGWIQALTAG